MALLASCSRESSKYVVLDGFAQGSTYHIVYNIPDNNNQDSVKAAIEGIFAKGFEDINNSISGYDSLSILSRFNRNENPLLDSIFIEIYNFSMEFFEISGGMVDVTSAPLFDLWGFGFTRKEKITQEKIDSVKRFTGREMFTLRRSDSGCYLAKRDSRAKLNFNAIAPGYTADYFARKLTCAGVSDFMIEVGGEIYCKGKNPKGENWKVGIDNPVDGNYIPGNDLADIVELTDKGIVTSGNYRKFYVEDGKKYSHTIDPVSGCPVQHNLLSATVIAENAILADAYATYFMVLGVEKAKEFLSTHPELEARLMYSEGDEIKVLSINQTTID